MYVKNRKTFYSLLVATVLAYMVVFVGAKNDMADVKSEVVGSIKSPEKTIEQPKPTKALLPVPYVSEAPDNDWTGPWKNACEEASIAMVDKFYDGDKEVSVADAKSYLSMLFTKENALYGSNANSDSERTNTLINDYSSFKGVIKTDPTLEDIKAEIDAGHPVIAFHRGFDLNNPHIPFLPTGSAFHATVVVGYDDTKEIFYVNDPGDETDGEDHVYSYSTYMGSLHDYDYDNNKADGPARVIFTSK